jgi:heme-degrading monooxygenase HmoA
MATGEFWTMIIWQMRAGQRGNVLEELTKNGIVPQYGKVPGVLSVKLLRIVEGDGVGIDTDQYIALTVYESREAYNRWWTTESRERIEMGQKLQGTMDNWLKAASQIRLHRSIVTVDEDFEQPEAPQSPPPRPGSGPIF